MLSLADLDACAVEIQVPLPGGEWRHGSGYVIGPCRILTALHVLVGQDAVKQAQPISAPDRIEVRAFGDFAARFGGAPDVASNRYLDNVRALARDGDYLWRPAELRWPKRGAAMPRFELAVLEVKPETALKHILSAPRIKCFKPTNDVLCRCVGFPDWMAMRATHGIDIANPRPVTGRLSFAATTSHSFHPFTAQNGGPRNEEEWQGLSGGAFLAEETGALIGVASAILPAKDNVGLWLTELADLAEGEEFQEFWTAAGLARPSRGAAISFPQFLMNPLPHLHEFDRSRPADRVLDVFDPIPVEGLDAASTKRLKAITKEDPCAPPIFIIAGRWIDLPDEMVRRIRQKIAPAFIDNHDGESPTVLRWRYAVERYLPDQIVAKLTEEIASSLNVERPRHVTSVASLCERMKRRDWYLPISVYKANEVDAAALCQFLSQFAKFEPTTQPPVLYVSIVPGDATIAADQDSRIIDFIERVKRGCAPFADRLLLIDDLFLHDCEFVDIQIWTSEHLAGHDAMTAEQCRTYLEHTFPTGTYPLQDVKDCLSSIPAAR
jgi:hypothetical protein